MTALIDGLIAEGTQLVQHAQDLKDLYASTASAGKTD